MFDFFKYKPKSDTENFDLTFGKFPEEKKTKNKDIAVSSNIDVNYTNACSVLHSNINGDIVVRRFNWNVNNSKKRGFIICADGLSDSDSINEYILMPIMKNQYHIENISDNDMLINYFAENVMPQIQITYETSLTKMTDLVNIGNAMLILDGCTCGIIIDVKSWDHRGVDSPLNEDVVQGPHEGFTEVLRSNTALIRKSVNCSDLVMESFEFGTMTKTSASLAYIDGIINKSLLNNIKKRLSDIDGEFIFSVFDIEKDLEERNFITMPQFITTERPDKVCRSLAEGRAALVLNGSSHALILPSNITDIIASPEDSYLRRPFSVFIKIIRIIAVVLSLLTPGLYLALTKFHSEAILTNMLVSLASARASVPFSSLTEIIIMEISFELIKEASIRIPGAIGSSLGIVGGLILGQAAVSAGIASPIVIIIVSVCGIASFAIPSYSLSFSFRISRFGYILMGAVMGIVGLACLLTIQMTLVLGTKNFGVPFCVPFSPKTSLHPFCHAIFDSHFKIKTPNYLKGGNTHKGDDDIE